MRQASVQTGARVSRREFCEERCDEMGGYWDVTARLCTIEVYADNICYRVVKKDGHWVLDKDK